MTPERWTRLAELFEAALERDPADRAAFLAAACPDDEEMRRELEQILDSHDRAGHFGETPAFQVAVVEARVRGSLAAGTTLGRYEIVSLVGKGGMGEVYRARDPQLGRDVGIKILPRRDEISAEQLRRFEREARTVGALNHANILTVYDVGIDTDIPYVVSELLEGETLRARLNNGPISIDEAIDIAEQIVAGLIAAHDKGIVHRDLKPENIFLTTAGVAKILDFGLAKQTIGIPVHDREAGSLTAHGLVIGTAGYVSPEQVRGGEADARSDVFALGSVLYEMLTGGRAFTGDSAVETMNAILTTEPPAVSTTTSAVPAELERLVHRCLEKDPERRAQAAYEVGAALSAPRAHRSPARARAAAIVFAVVVMAVAGVSSGDRAPGAAAPPVSPTAIDAYELYTKAQRARHNNRWNDARTLFQQSLRIDPEFVLARAQLVNVLDRLGESAAAAAERQTVSRQVQRVPERQRLLANALQDVDSNPARAIDQLERLLQRYPDEEEAYDAIIHAYTHARAPAYLEKTLAFMQRWERAVRGPGSGHFHNHYGYVYIDHGLYTEAEREFRAYIRVSPDEANAYDSLAELFLLTNRPAQAAETYDQALRLNPQFGWSRFGRAYALGMLGRYDEALAELTTLETLGQRAGVSAVVLHELEALVYSRAGRADDAEAHLGAAHHLARERQDGEGEADAEIIEAALAVEQGQRGRAVAHADRAVALAPRISLDIMRARRGSVAHLLAGIAETRAGRLDAARRRLQMQQQLDAGADPIQRSWQRALAGEIALAGRRFDEAETAFRDAEYQVGSSFAIYPVPVALGNNMPFRDGPARTAAARGEIARAIDLYRRLNEPGSGSKWTALFDPRYERAAAALAGSHAAR